MTQNQIMFQQHKEQVRHNLATEGENQRHNVVTETETNRTNLANEGIKRESNAINLQSVVEQGRHNKATEQLGYANLAENSRHNLMTEKVQYLGAQAAMSQAAAAHKNASAALQNADTNRYNADTNLTLGMLGAANAQNQLSLDKDKLAETHRHNKWTEGTNLGLGIGGLVSDTLVGTLKALF